MLFRSFGSIPGLANRAIIPVESARDAIARFLAPDLDSRTPDNEGRRIEPIDGGWRLLNHEKYRAIRDEETTKESKRKYINNKRALEREKANKINGVENVDRSRYNAEAEAEAEAGTSKSLKPLSVIGTRLSNNWNLPDEWAEWASKEKQMSYPEVKQMAHQFKDYWIAVPGTKGKKLDWAATWRNWVRNNRGNGKVKEMSQTAKAIALLEGMK